MSSNSETNKKLVVTSLLIATFLTAIEGTIVSTAMPKIVEDLGGSHLYTWVISIYLLATVISTPIFGKLADLYGRKKMFTIGVIIFLIGSMLSGFSQTMHQLVVFRLIQGIGAGALTTIPFTIIGDVFSFELRAKIQGLISSVWGISGIIGPLAGGFIVDQITWHWIFFLNLPFGILSFILLSVSLHEQVEKKKQIIDYAGIFTFTVSMSSFLYALTLLKQEKHITTGIFALFIIALVSVCLFLYIEAKGKEPMLPLSLFKIHSITVANVVGFLLGFILVAVTFYIPLWVQGVTNLNATLSGITLMPMSITWPIGAFLTGKWLGKMSIGRLAVIGIAINAAGCFGLVFFHANTTLPFMMVVTAILGFGFGLALTVFTVIVQSAVDWNLRGAAIGSNNLMRNLGQAIGIAVSGLWLSDELKGYELESSLHTVFILLFILALVAIAIGGVLMGKREKELSSE
ncbi:MDR family MFS transporter [Schinkia azotoformans]|uniref:Major facilitator superfamily protein n=1 Tax=Schinkia azotoformans LMG 9581 TaxID=1131731 RepID=K6DIM2_SCHAZ|nr:MDR family MFS transporter [Schinkia azotoformans]EKN67968.1 major facilitator superfamily protein [Schinkia azotoformans LMG 9581]MEC1637012.1 MDR family MFS transporter [Schinkia azotoformans]MEC1722168.1 MDR family MFS transporter [Schinkia azotoformans]MEC1947022.1 MDR family MFS transporter [Schinkia azotoformans]MED4351387.1 MDR family MFS transporter [Schinkia azotoformans]